MNIRIVLALLASVALAPLGRRYSPVTADIGICALSMGSDISTCETNRAV